MFASQTLPLSSLPFSFSLGISIAFKKSPYWYSVKFQFP
jgi:hypothetical protein